MPEHEIGKITHYFDKIGVAVLKLSAPLKVGEKIRVDAMEPFVQTISSMQVHKNSIESAKAGDDVGLKVDKPCHDGDKVVKLS